jgi:uncharacterized protein (TIGR03790 family)
MNPSRRIINRAWIRHTLLLAAGLGCGFISPRLSRAEAGASVVVVYNSRLPESRELALYYAHQRQVPSNQIFGFDLPLSEEIRRQGFLDQLQNPLLERLEATCLWTLSPQETTGPSKSRPAERRLLSSAIRYALLCYGVPTRIAEDKALVEKDLDNLRPELRRNQASVDSQLACLPLAFVPFRWTGPWPNPAYAATNTNLLHPTNGILLVTRLDGPSPEVARRLVDLAMEAETNGLWGRAYFDARGLTNSGLQLGDSWLQGAERVCRMWGFDTELDTNEQIFPAGKILSDVAIYAGWYAGQASGALAQPQVDFRPGAFAYHLHSFSAQTIRSVAANWVGPLLHRGATATIGYVAEPYLALTVDLPVFFSRWCFHQFSFGEAAWAGMNSLSWQSVVVGDPLYRPFPRSLRDLHLDLERRDSPLLAWSHLLVVNRNQLMNTPLTELVRYLESVPLTRRSSVLTEKMGDLYWANKKFKDALEFYDLALQRNPTVSEKMRLLLHLAYLRSYFGPVSKALQNYQSFLAEFPDYPDTLDIYRKMLPLARSVADDKLVERCELEIKRRGPTPEKQP